VGLQSTALGCTHIAAIEWFFGKRGKEGGKSREQNYAIALGIRKQRRVRHSGLAEVFITAVQVAFVLPLSEGELIP